MLKTQNSKQYDLEERTLEFAKSIREFIKKLPKSLTNLEYIKQLIRSSGSVGANYIEANEALSKRDFIMRIKISRKEAKEARYWLQLIDIPNPVLGEKSNELIKETTELMMILSSIMRNSQ